MFDGEIQTNQAFIYGACVSCSRSYSHYPLRDSDSVFIEISQVPVHGRFGTNPG